MSMPTLVVSVLLAALAAAFLLLRPYEDKEHRRTAGLWVGLGILAPALLAVLFFLEPPAFGGARLAMGLVGVLSVAWAELMGARARPSGALAIGAFAGSLAFLFPEAERSAAAWSLAAGAGVLAAALPSMRTAAVAFGAATVALANRTLDLPFGSWAAFAVLAAVLLSEILPAAAKLTWAARAGGLAAGAAVLALMAFRGQPGDPVWQTALLGLAIGAVIAWIASGEVDLLLRGVLGALLATAAAATAAIIGQGTGLAVAAFAAAASLILLGKPNWMGSLSPLLALAFFRLLREQGMVPSLSATDVDQYVSMVGMIVGVMVAALPSAWERSSPSCRWMRAAGAVLVVAAMAGAAPILGIGLGFRAVSGMLIGLGLGSLLDLLRGERTPVAISALVGMSALTLVAIPGFSPYTSLVRADKIEILRWAFVAYALFALGMAIYTALGKSKEAREA